MKNYENIITFRTFLNERMRSYPREPSDGLKHKWLLEEFPSWLQERVIVLQFV